MFSRGFCWSRTEDTPDVPDTSDTPPAAPNLITDPLTRRFSRPAVDREHARRTRASRQRPPSTRAARPRGHASAPRRSAPAEPAGADLQARVIDAPLRPPCRRHHAPRPLARRVARAPDMRPGCGCRASGNSPLPLARPCFAGESCLLCPLSRRCRESLTTLSLQVDKSIKRSGQGTEDRRAATRQ